MKRFSSVFVFAGSLFLMVGLWSACEGADSSDDGGSIFEDGNDGGVNNGDCDHSGFTGDSASAEMLIPGHFQFQAIQTRDDGKVDRVGVRLRHGGAFTGAQGNGIHDVGGSTFGACDNCLTLSTGCETDSEECETVYFATEGSIEITNWDASRFEFTVVDALLKEVNINNPVAVMPIEGGETYCLAGESLGVDTNADLAPIVPESSCVEAGTGPYLGHNVANFSLTNCLGETFSLHDRCGQSNALWIMATTGWCTACSTILHVFASEIGGDINRQNISAAYPGLDMLVVLGENVEGVEPDEAFCLGYAESHDLDPTMLVMDFVVDGIRIDMIDPIDETHSFESLATTWLHINPYFTEEANGAVISSYPWNALLRGTNMEYYWSDNVGFGIFSSMRESLLEEGGGS